MAPPNTKLYLGIPSESQFPLTWSWPAASKISPNQISGTRSPEDSSPDIYAASTRKNPGFHPYLKINGRDLGPMELAERVAEMEQAWFEAKGAKTDPKHYTARHTLLALSLVAFHESFNSLKALQTANQPQLRDHFIKRAEGFLKTLKLLKPYPTSASNALLRLSNTLGYFLIDLEKSKLTPDQKEIGVKAVKKILREAYGLGIASTRNKPEFRYVHEFAQARFESFTPPDKESKVPAWVESIRDHLARAQEAAQNLKKKDKKEDPVRSVYEGLIQSDWAALVPIRSPKSIGREFVARLTNSFVTLIASDIDRENGDSKTVAGRRYLPLRVSLEEEIAKNPDKDFMAALEKIKTPESDHLRGLIRKSEVLQELIKLSSQAVPLKSNLDVENLIGSWSANALSLLEKHSKNKFFGKNEQPLSSTKEILKAFLKGDPTKPSTFEAGWETFSGQKFEKQGNILSRRAHLQLNHLQSAGFSLEHGISNFLSWKTLAFVAGASVLGRLVQLGYLQFAGVRGALGPRWFSLVREGALTPLGHFASGTVTAGFLSTGFSFHQFMKDQDAKRPEAWDNFKRNLGLGLLINTAALGISAATMKASGLHAWAARPVSGGPVSQFFRRSLPMTGIHAFVATGAMLGTNAGIRAISNRGKANVEKSPLITLEETVETYLTMLSLSGADALLQKPFAKLQLGPHRALELEKIKSSGVFQTDPNGLTPEEGMKRLERLALRGVPLEELKKIATQSLPKGELTPEGEDLAVRLEDGRTFFILKASKGREGTQLGREVYGKVTDLFGAPDGVKRMVFVGSTLAGETIHFQVAVDASTAKNWGIRINSELQLISVKRKKPTLPALPPPASSPTTSAGSETPPPATPAESPDPLPPPRPRVRTAPPPLPPEAFPSRPSSASAGEELPTPPLPETLYDDLFDPVTGLPTSRTAPAGEALPPPSPPLPTAKVARIHGPRIGQVRHFIDAPDGTVLHVRETFVLDAAWDWGTKIHPQEVQGFITKYEVQPDGKVRFTFDGAYTNPSGQEVLLKFQCSVDAEVAEKWNLGAKKAAILEPFEPHSTSEETPGKNSPEGGASTESETRSLPAVSVGEEPVSGPPEKSRPPWMDGAEQFCDPEGETRPPPSRLPTFSPDDSAISQPGRRVTFSPGGTGVDPSAVTMMVSPDQASSIPSLPSLPAAGEFSQPAVTASRPTNPVLIDEVLRKVVINAGSHRYVTLTLTDQKGHLSCVPLYSSELPKPCRDGQISLVIKSSDPRKPQASLIDHEIRWFSPEVQQAIRGSSIFTDEISTVGFLPSEELLECAEPSEPPPPPLEVKEPAEAPTYYVPEFEIWWQTKVQDVMSEYLHRASKGQLKKGGRLRILMSQKEKSIRPIWFPFEQFPEGGPLPPPMGNDKLLFLIRIKGDIIRDPLAYRIEQIDPEIPRSFTARWQTMMKRVIANFRGK